jgi:hypothetical protein
MFAKQCDKHRWYTDTTLENLEKEQLAPTGMKVVQERVQVGDLLI